MTDKDRLACKNCLNWVSFLHDLAEERGICAIGIPGVSTVLMPDACSCYQTRVSYYYTNADFCCKHFIDKDEYKLVTDE